jgi:hypothetical protein
MRNKELIQFALTVSDGAVMRMIDKASDVATTSPTSKGGCHPLWVLGHLTLVEGMIPAVIYGEENPVAHLQPLFGEHSEPMSNAGAYPSFTELRSRYSELRARNLKILESLSEEDLERPVKAPPKGREQEFATFGRSFLVVALHQCMHRSHVTDALRTSGRMEVAAIVVN